MVEMELENFFDQYANANCFFLNLGLHSLKSTVSLSLL